MPENPFPSLGPGPEEPPGTTPLPGPGSGPQDHAAGPAASHDISGHGGNPADGNPASGDPTAGPPPDGPGGGGGENPPDGPGGGGGENPPGGPGGGWGEVPPDGPEQGLFICLPAETMELTRFAGEDGKPAMPPGPLLASVAAAVAGGDGSGLAGVSEDFLFAVISGGRRMASWGTWLEFSAMRELALRHPAVPRSPRGTAPVAPGTTPVAPGTTPAPDPAQPGTQQPPGTAKPGGTSPGGTGPAGTSPAGTSTAAAAGGDRAAAIPADDGRVQFSEFVPDELSLDLKMTWPATADRISYACALATRLPVTFASLGGGLLDPVRAKIIYEQTEYLSAADAAKADPVLAAAAQDKTYGELRAHAAKLALKLDPESAERRKQARRRDAHVRAFREESGNAGITAREMPSDEVLASMQHVDQRARDLRAAGIPGTLEDLRVRAYLDLLQERDTRDTLHDPNPGHNHRPGQDDGNDGPAGNDDGGNDGPAGNDDGGNDGPSGPGRNGGPGGSPGPGSGPAQRSAGSAGPSLAALVNITVPLATLLGESGTPGEAAGFGLLDAQSARDLIAAAARDPRTRWCVTALHPDGTAAAHGCATGQHTPPPGPDPPVPETPETTSKAQEYLRSLKVQLTMIARGTCDHRHAETGYKPSRKLQHLIRTRNTCCAAPGCGRPAARCDLDHTLAWHLGGPTCECDLAPLCRHHHRVKQAQGWRLDHPQPGVLVWRTPGGRKYTTTPTQYPQ